MLRARREAKLNLGKQKSAKLSFSRKSDMWRRINAVHIRQHASINTSDCSNFIATTLWVYLCMIEGLAWHERHARAPRVGGRKSHPARECVGVATLLRYLEVLSNHRLTTNTNLSTEITSRYV